MLQTTYYFTDGTSLGPVIYNSKEEADKDFCKIATTDTRTLSMSQSRPYEKFPLYGPHKKPQPPPPPPKPLKVKDLIEYLQSLDPEMDVMGEEPSDPNGPSTMVPLMDQDLTVSENGTLEFNMPYSRDTSW